MSKPKTNAVPEGTLTGTQRKRAKHLMHNHQIPFLSERSRLMAWAIRRWGKVTVFGPSYHKYFDDWSLRMGLSAEVSRLHIKVWRWSYETWAFTYTWANPITHDERI